MKIFLDVDDTLADFRGHAIAQGVPPWTGSWYTTDPATWTQEQKDIQAATNAMMMREEFWLTMPTTEHAHELIGAAFSRGETYLLTALPSFAKDENLQLMIRRAKTIYARDVLHIPAPSVIICQRKDKVKYARSLSGLRPANLLVDDATQNCAEWADAGGIPILHRTVRESVAALKEAFAT